MKILVTTDGSDAALASIDYLARFPLPEASQVTVMTVVREILAERDVQQLSESFRESYQQARTTAETEAAQLLQHEVEKLQQAGLEADGHIAHGHPAEEILRLATDIKCDLIVIGSHGRTGTQRFLLGSVSDRVFEYAPCSVLIVKPGRPPVTPKRWLVAFDDSPPARSAIALCASLPLSPQTAINVISVMPMIHLFRQDVRQQLSWVWQEKKQAARLALDWVDREFDWQEVALSTELLEHEDTAQALLERAEALDSDLIVIGNKSRTALQRFLRGSVTARVAHHAPCSVLSVRASSEPATDERLGHTP
jgi:nucleotide-binding universal stress UspA family protein